MEKENENLDFIYYHLDKLMELGKMGAAIKELGDLSDKYTRVQLATQMANRVNDLFSSTYMIKHYLEKLTQSIEGTVDDIPVSEEVSE